MSWATLTEMLEAQAHHTPDALFVRFAGAGAPVEYSYGRMWLHARQWSATLRGRGVRPGMPVVIAAPNDDVFVGAYFGALLAGAIPAPMAPIRSGSQDVSRVLERLRALSIDVAVGTPSLETLARAAASRVTILTALDPAEGTVDMAGMRAKPTDTALLQFTSGTSGSSKGVRLSHRALVGQTRLIGEALGLDPTEDAAVSWLPLFHDMGLIGFLLTPAAAGGAVTLLPTERFILRPALWMRAVTDFNATITGAPSSAYSLAARFTRIQDAPALDLSGLRIALVGGETVARQSLLEFEQRFAEVGFSPSAFMPSYGLAEYGLAVTITRPGMGARFDEVERSRIQDADFAAPLRTPASQHETSIVASVGTPVRDTTVRIVGPDGEPLADRHVGEVIVRGPSLMDGYVNAPEATADALRDGWLWTGDLGYLADGHLYLTGRRKELLIVAGSKYYPDDLERLVREIPGVSAGRVVAVGCDDQERATSRIIVLAETTLTDTDRREALRRTIREALLQADYPISDVTLLPPKTIRNTPNGKLRRTDTLARYLAGEFA